MKHHIVDKRMQATHAICLQIPIIYIWLFRLDEICVGYWNRHQTLDVIIRFRAKLLLWLISDDTMGS